MKETLEVEVEAALPGAEPRRLAVRAPADAQVGAILDAVARHLGVEGSTGAVQARSLVSNTWLDRDVPFGQAGVLRGERLVLTVGLSPAGSTGALRRWPRHRPGDAEGRVAVNRPPRTVRVEPALDLTLPKPPQGRSPRRFPLGAMVIPLAIGGILVLVTRHWEIALFALFTPVMVAWNYYEERRARADDLREHGRTFDEEADAVRARLRGFAHDWLDWQLATHPDPDQVAAATRELSPRVWERQRGDADDLHLRLGTSRRRAPAVLREQTSSHLAASDRPDYESELDVPSAPVAVALWTEGPLAVLGERVDTVGVTTWLSAQLATLHSPADLRLALASTDVDTCDWWQWLPHLADDLLGEPAVAHTARDTHALLTAVAALGRRRREESEQGRRVRPPDGPVLVVVVDQDTRPDPALLGQVALLSDVGIALIWTGSDAETVPTATSVLLSVERGARGAVLTGLRGGAQVDLLPETFGRVAALTLATSLAPLQDAGDVRRAHRLPERVVLEDVLPEPASIVAMRRRWESAHPTELIARIGLSHEGPVDLDLGPTGSHVLAGGTTGSGKSELLQAMVGALAATYPPSRVGFLLVDYKGGSAFKDAMHLPHCVGVVTDLDEHLTRRALAALEAEIRRREQVLAAADARDLTELRLRSGSTSIGDLLIVVDEFATLAKEVPEFVDGVVDIAARGRSLGLRLVLATQRPAGVITDRIRANVDVRIALRVNDEADSLDIVDARDAAHIRRSLPGRGYLRRHRDLLEFQSAYAGGPLREESGALVEVTDLSDPGAASDRSLPRHDAGGPTTLEALVEAARRLLGTGRWEPPHVPWLPPLPAVVTTTELAATADAPDGAALLALADLPDRQVQRVAVFDPASHGAFLVFGTSRSGKTTVLRTIAAGLLDRLGPDRLQLYALDFAGHGLHALADAPQCLATVGPDDPGRIARVLRRLTAVVATRKQLLAREGATSFGELADRSATLPRVVLLLDGYAGAASALERLDGGRVLEQLERLVTDGPGVGIHVLLTADRRAAIPQALSSVVTTRLVLRMAEKDDYALLGVEPALVRSATLPPGRGFIGGTTEVQVAVLAGAEPAAEQAALAAVVARARSRWSRTEPPVDRMPDEVGLSDLPPAVQPLVLPVAVGDTDVAPVAVDLRDGHLLVAGPPHSGRTTALAALAAAARRQAAPPALVLVHRRANVLEKGVAWDLGPLDADDVDAVEGLGGAVSALLADGHSSVLVLCDDADTYGERASSALEELARTGRDAPVRVVATSDNRWAQRAYTGLVPEVRRSKQALLLAPEVELDGDLVGVRLRAPLEPIGMPGRGFLVTGGRAELIQLAQPSVMAARTSVAEHIRRPHEARLVENKGVDR
ncbi:DNA segregation ATPase FtsK/SpoIIIE, S-DNA-T family [Nocardioides terrae]|uniref:DNA segregation ATPase FtsK/SpoIIIE, S-DNA-T family n=1 Tax=Nocardioides terrae TaxID=574651 RepID=A0A1I1J802_9ACTN|nr:FtsK/SpoIIIE domain-containing protein [Nocardioides terrae]SFC44684.1 DNA segregation ATPase FtsK/SpoIIIE, S-DNA-T family [Nocardioides terrae]